MKKFENVLFASVFVLGAIFQSCSNFLESGDFKEQLESDIEYANSPAYDIRVECDEEFGSIAVSLFSKKVTDEFYVEFRMSSIVQFLGWKAYSRTSGVLTELSSDYIKFSDNEEIESGLYRVRVKFLKAVSGIVIKPNCQILPKVSEVLPEFYDFGVDQDSTIKIKFNKCVNPDTFGDFSGIKIKSGSENLRDYYGTPYFSDDNKTINIPTVKTKDIVTSGTKDIFVSFEFAESPLDADGMKIDFGETHRFRVTIAGSLSGGFMVGGMYTGAAINQRQIGRQINTPNAEGQTKTEDLVGIAMETDQDSMAHRQAEEIQQQIENGEEVSNRDAGRLAQTLQQEAYEMLEKADNGEDVSPEAVEKSLNTLRSVAEILGENTQNKGADTGDKDASLQLA
ncbi:MAG: hypothetical protein IKN34_02825, partial [Treponema sp.]|nr:hypothetical protein [Treponema sp.]